MFLLQFKIFIRNFFRRPLYPTIGILVLSIGITCLLLASVWIKDELNYDKSFPNHENMYRLTIEKNDTKNGYYNHAARSFYEWLKNIKSDIPGIKDFGRFVYRGENIVKIDNRVFRAKVFRANKDFVRFFSIQKIQGDLKNAFEEPNTAIITENASKKYFGTSNSIGKVFRCYQTNDKEGKEFRIISVVQDLPVNTHFHFEIVVTMDPSEWDNWFYNYVMLDEHAKPDEISAKFQTFAAKYIDAEEVKTLKPHFQKITDIHLESVKEREIESNGNKKIVVIIGILALFVFFVSVFNFFNFQYVVFLKNKRNLLIMNYSGAHFGDFLYYQLPSSLLYALISCLLGMVGFESLLGLLNTLLGKNPEAGSQYAYSMYMTILPIVILLIVLASILPVLMLNIKKNINSFSFDQLIKKKEHRFLTLKTFITVQYVFSALLIITVVIVSKQVNYIMSHRLGKNQNNIVCVKRIPVQVIDKYQEFKMELLSYPIIQNVTCTFEDPADDNLDMMGTEAHGFKPNEKWLYVYPVDDNFFDFYDIKLKAGKNFEKFYGNDSIPEDYILNESAAKYMGWTNEEAIGKPFSLIYNVENDKNLFHGGSVTGVVEDFQTSSVKTKIKPTVYFPKSYWLFSAQIKYDSSQLSQSLDLIQKTWKKFYPDFPFEYEFVENMYEQVYKNEMQLKMLSFILGLIAVVLSCIGLFGITGIIYETKTKEIGIRKVNGAQMFTIMKWLLKDIVAIVVIALIVATPLSYYMMNRWLQNFAYKISISWWIFIFAGVIILLIAIVTVAWQSWKAAGKNPVESLRYE